MATYTTDVPRCLLALPAGALAGAVLTSLWSVWGWQGVLADAAPSALSVLVYAAAIWGAGLAVIATPPWAGLHLLGWREWWVAALLGAALTFLAVLTLMTGLYGLHMSGASFSAGDGGGRTWDNGALTAYGLVQAVKLAGACSAMGAIVGLVVWRIAYRRQS